LLVLIIYLSISIYSDTTGAALMKDPDHLRQLLYDMRRQVQIPVNVKCRLGVDDLDSYEYVHDFMESVRDSGVKRVIIHARKCLLKGLSTRDNRSIPPLRYPWVFRLARDFPELDIGINGGITTLDHAHQLLTDGHHMYAPGGPQADDGTDGEDTASEAGESAGASTTRVPIHSVMIGRAAWSNPVLFADVDRRIYGEQNPGFSRREIVEQYADYVEELTDHDIRTAHGSTGVVAPVVNLFHACAHSSKIRQAFATCSRKGDGPAEVAASLRAVLRLLPADLLDEPLAPVEDEIPSDSTSPGVAVDVADVVAEQSGMGQRPSLSP
jgi:tRNA-dihydrouridine synthase A